MVEWIESLILGVVQGITEFLPVSSDGHLVVTQQIFAWLTGRPHSGEENLFFDIMLHVGTLAAILLHYRNSIMAGARGFLLGAKDVPPGFECASVWRVGLLAIVATLPLIPLKLFFIDWIKETFKSSQAAGIGFLITAAVLLLVSLKLRGPAGKKGPAETTFLDALLIGLAQMFAPLPGVSRSGLTIASALALGFSPVWAVGFSLLIAVPAISGAALSELKDTLTGPRALALTPDRIAQTVVATILAGDGRLHGHSLADTSCSGRAAMVFFCILDHPGDRGPGCFVEVRRIARCPPTTGFGPARREPRCGTACWRSWEASRGALDRAHAAGARPGGPRVGDQDQGRRQRASGLLLGRSLA